MKKNNLNYKAFKLNKIQMIKIQKMNLKFIRIKF